MIENTIFSIKKSKKKIIFIKKKKGLSLFIFFCIIFNYEWIL